MFILSNLSDILNYSQCVYKYTCKRFINDCVLIEYRRIYEVVSKCKYHISKWLSKAYPYLSPPMEFELCAKAWRK